MGFSELLTATGTVGIPTVTMIVVLVLYTRQARHAEKRADLLEAANTERQARMEAKLWGNGGDEKGLRGDVQRLEEKVVTLAAELAEARTYGAERDRLTEARLNAGNGQFTEITGQLTALQAEWETRCNARCPEANRDA